MQKYMCMCPCVLSLIYVFIYSCIQWTQWAAAVCWVLFYLVVNQPGWALSSWERYSERAHRQAHVCTVSPQLPSDGVHQASLISLVATGRCTQIKPTESQEQDSGQVGDIICAQNAEALASHAKVLTLEQHEAMKDSRQWEAWWDSCFEKFPQAAVWIPSRKAGGQVREELACSRR